MQSGGGSLTGLTHREVHFSFMGESMVHEARFYGDEIVCSEITSEQRQRLEEWLKAASPQTPVVRKVVDLPIPQRKP
jgi:citrate lyase synthetase